MCLRKTNRVNRVKSKGPTLSGSLITPLADFIYSLTWLLHNLIDTLPFSRLTWAPSSPSPSVSVSLSFLRHLDSSSNERPDISTIQRRVKVQPLSLTYSWHMLLKPTSTVCSYVSVKSSYSALLFKRNTHKHNITPDQNISCGHDCSVSSLRPL